MEALGEDDLRLAIAAAGSMGVPVSSLLSALTHARMAAPGSTQSQFHGAISSLFAATRRNDDQLLLQASSPVPGPAPGIPAKTSEPVDGTSQRQVIERVGCRAALVACGLLLEEAEGSDRPGLPLVGRGAGQVGDAEKLAMQAASLALEHGSDQLRMILLRSFQCACCSVHGAVRPASIARTALSVLLHVLPSEVRSDCAGRLGEQLPPHSPDSMEESRLVHALREAVAGLGEGGLRSLLSGISLTGLVACPARTGCAIAGSCAKHIPVCTPAVIGV